MEPDADEVFKFEAEEFEEEGARRLFINKL